jgi:hypothetical protein
MDTILDFHEKNLVDTPAPTHVKFWLRPWIYYSLSVKRDSPKRRIGFDVHCIGVSNKMKVKL